MKLLSIFLAVSLVLPVPSRMAAQAPAPRLNLVILEGEGAINNMKLRTAREPIVQVEDENHKPVAGAAVVFALPSNGAGGAFGTAGQTFTTVTDASGRAVGRGLRPNNVAGRYQIRVTASKDGQTATTNISMTNALPAAAAGGIATGKLIAILAAAGAAVAGGVVAATRGGGNGNATTPSPTTITPGTGQVTPPR
jgi:hypothetical protein